MYKNVYDNGSELYYNIENGKHTILYFADNKEICNVIIKLIGMLNKEDNDD